MKRIFFIFLFVFSVFSFLFCEDFLSQKIHDVDSPVFKNLQLLYVKEKRALPNATGPWSDAELLKMYCSLSGEYENSELQKVYAETGKLLQNTGRIKLEEDVYVNYDLFLHPEFYFHSNPDIFNTSNYWYYDYLKRKNLIDVTTELLLKDWLYLGVDTGLGYATETKNPLLYGNYAQSSIYFILKTGLDVFNVNIPEKALISFGGKNWNFSAGRSVLKWGSGETGNLFLGGNTRFHNAARFTVFSDIFKFTFVSIFYPFSGEAETTDQNTIQMNGFNVFLAHRYDTRFFKDRLSLGLSEAIMYQSSTGTFDLRVFNPVTIYHNYFIRGNSNSILGIDLDYTLMSGLNLYSQIVIDEQNVPGEPGAQNEGGWRPSKRGFLGGIKYYLPLEDSLWKFNLEGVYTDPLLYLREKYNPATGQYGVSFYGKFREFTNSYGIQFLKECVGYRYGGDAVVADLRSSYEKTGLWGIDGEIFYMAHGIMKNDIYEDWIYGEKTEAPSTEDIAYGKNPENAQNASGEVEHILRLSIYGNYQLLSYMKLYAGLDNFYVWNKENKKAPVALDFQMHLGAEFKF